LTDAVARGHESSVAPSVLTSRARALCVALLSLDGTSCGSRTGLDTSFSVSADARQGTDCSDSARAIVVLTKAPSSDTRGQLLRFDPQAAAFSPVVTVACLPPIQLPTALTVDREGNAYVAGVSLDRHVVHVDTSTGACNKPGLTASISGFGMAFSSDTPGKSDTLYIVDDGKFESVDPSTFSTVSIGTFGPVGPQSAPVFGRGLIAVYLTAGSAGDVFTLDTSVPSAVRPAFSLPVAPTMSIGRVDKATGAVTDAWPVSVPNLSPDWSGVSLGGFVFWGGDFYFFLDGGPGTVVWRFRSSEGSMQQVAQTDRVILAAGTSTCAPLDR
jgi:hypothetical protein